MDDFGKVLLGATVVLFLILCTSMYDGCTTKKRCVNYCAYEDKAWANVRSFERGCLCKVSR